MLQNRISVFSVFADFLDNITAECSIYYVIWQKTTFVIFAFLQGSYGIVKLAYNKDDDVQYVSKIYLFKQFLNNEKTFYFQAMKILSKKKLKRKGGIFGKSKTYGRKKIDRQAKKANKKVCINHPEAIF